MTNISDSEIVDRANLDTVLLDAGEISAENSEADWVIGLSVHVVDVLSGYTVAGRLTGFTPGEVRISVEELMTEHRSVMVQFDSFAFEGETLCCLSTDRGYEANITINDVQKNGLRREPRFPVKLAGQMFPPHSEPVPIMIVDISRDGLGIELPVAVEVDQPIALVSGSVFVFATVRYCRSLPGSGFRAGVEMQHVLERPIETQVEEPAGLLGKVFGWRGRRNSGPTPIDSRPVAVSS
jgi:PilZ domain